MTGRSMGQAGLKDDTSTARTSPVAISTPAPALAPFRGCLFLVEHVLRFDGHVHHIWRIVVEFGVCKVSESINTKARKIESTLHSAAAWR